TKIEEVRLQALDVTILTNHLRQGGKRLVQGIGGDRTNGASEYVSFDQPDHLQEISVRENSVGKVAVHLEQERIGDVDLELTQVFECPAKGLVVLGAERHGAVVGGVFAELLDQGFDIR